MISSKIGDGWLYCADVLECYPLRSPPVCIVADGFYGIGGYYGDTTNTAENVRMYKPHVEQWSKFATPKTTLCLWCTHDGWASGLHELLKEFGWVYNSVVIWDKGLRHLAHNYNGQTIKRFPEVTEICVIYTRRQTITIQGVSYAIKDYLRSEWERTGLPIKAANAAAGVKDAASRKWLTKDRHFYPPYGAEFSKLVTYANEFGSPLGKPYFSQDGVSVISPEEWDALRPKFNPEYKITNVWSDVGFAANERIRKDGKTLHPNQKPVELLERIVRATSDKGDVVWECFAGTASACAAAIRTGRRFYAAEIFPVYHEAAAARLETELHKPSGNQIKTRKPRPCVKEQMILHWDARSDECSPSMESSL